LPVLVSVMSNSDLQAARALLDGLIGQKPDGRIFRKYLDRGSPEELEARRELATLLRSPDNLDRQLRESLAGLFDPGPPEWQQRQLVFDFRCRGKPPDHVANTQIFVEVHDSVKSGATASAAILGAAQRFSMSEERVKRVWSQYRRVYSPRAGRHR
jgi:hypothetical protein